MQALRYSDGVIEALDQTALPDRERWLSLRTTSQLANAIKALKIRGAPMLGIIGAFGVAQAALRCASTNPQTVLAAASKAGVALRQTRPTAVNLAWAIDRSLRLGTALVSSGADASSLRKALEAEAHAIAQEDADACMKMAELGQRFVSDEATILTHCNTGFLVTGGIGTAIGVIRHAHELGCSVNVLVDETRPLLQGSRLTSWELGKLGVPHAVIADSSAPALIASGEVDVVLVGADRIAANGDTANKIGTYSLAIAAKVSGVPFVVVAPTSTIDPSIADGTKIPLEERDEREVLSVLGKTRIAPVGARARNLAFDVTPSAFISAIVTECGIAEPPNEQTIAHVLQPR
ncbi:MAG: S-methyl-5-thioribose-1-phosphate isomerase [Actinomycetota bacterium]